MAFAIGTIELGGLVSSKLHVGGPLGRFLATFGINQAGFVIAGLFVVVWAVAVAYWRLARVETRWHADVVRTKEHANSMLSVRTAQSDAQ